MFAPSPVADIFSFLLEFCQWKWTFTKAHSQARCPCRLASVQLLVSLFLDVVVVLLPHVCMEYKKLTLRPSLHPTSNNHRTIESRRKRIYRIHFE